MSSWLQTFRDMDGVTQAVVVAAGVAILLTIVWLFVLLRRRKAGDKPARADLTIDLTSLGTHGPPGGGAQVDCYNVPVRLAAVVLAPAGRLDALPPRSAWAELLDQIVPGLKDVIHSHRPLLRAWPEQLSAKGFSHQFFANAELPGDRGKGSPWCSLAGKFEADGDFHMAAMIFRSAKPNSLGEFTLEPTDWLGVLRVRSGE